MIRILPLFEVPEHSELITDWLFQAFGSENSRDFSQVSLTVVYGLKACLSHLWPCSMINPSELWGCGAAI